VTAAAVPRDAFAPQPTAGMRTGFGLAFAVHVLLVIALAWSVHWKSSDPEGVVAELWSAVPQMAAPRAVAPEPQPVQPQPVPPQPPTPRVVAPEPQRPAPPLPPKPEPAVAPREDAQIGIERAAREKERRAETEQAEAARKAERTRRDEARKLEDEKQARLLKQRLADEQAEKKKLAEQARLAEAKADAAANARADAKQAAIREANLRHMKSLAGDSDDPGTTGTAARTSGPSAGYAGRIKARIKPNIVLTGAVAGNPTSEIEVRVAPDGTIVGRRITKSSGSALWDETVLRAIDKTEILPRDTDGRVPPVFTMTFRPLE
jgi:colicin import membrane protein